MPVSLATPKTLLQPAAWPALHQTLREATKAAQQQVTGHALLKNLLQPAVQRQHYAQALAALHAPVAYSDRCMQRSQPLVAATTCPVWQPRLGALQADMADMQVNAPDQSMSFPDPQCLSAYVGLRYALEAMGLGGQFMAWNLQQALGRETGTRYLVGPGARTLKDWDGFLAFAEQACPKHQVEIALVTAKGWFAACARHLDRSQARMPA